MYEAITHDISVKAESIYLDDQSAPSEDRYVWAYRIVIENRGAQTVQILSRYWNITDGLGQRHEVHGEGVVGKQPILKPGESFEYTSGTPLATPGGIMAGQYTVQESGGKSFQIDIPAFSLDSPYQRAILN